MAFGALSILSVGALGLALVLVAGGVVLLVVGARRHDDSTSRPFLALGVGLLILGTVVLVPSLVMAGRMVLGLG